MSSYLIFLLLSATLGPLLFGYHLAELNAPQNVMTCGTKTLPLDTELGRAERLPQCIDMNAWEFGLVSSFFTLGGLVGALAAGPVTAAKGRLRTMRYAAVASTVGAVFEAAAMYMALLTLGRFISGLGAGAFMVVVPIYIFELAPPGKKGVFGMGTQIMANLGILITQVLGLFWSTGRLWRVILAAGGGIALVQALMLGLAGQESPQYLADHGKPAEARMVLQKLRGPAADIDAEVMGWAPNLEAEQEALLDMPPHHRAPAHDGAEKPTLGPLEVLRHPDTAPAVFAVTMIMLAQQLTGINSIVMYGVGLLSSQLGTHSALLNAGVSALNLLVTTAAAPLPDRLGRKPCLLFSICGMGVSSLALALAIPHSLPALSAVAVLAFVASFALGLGPIPFMLASELVAPDAVAATQSIALATNWLATFAVAQFFPVVNERLAPGRVYFLFCGAAALFAALVWRCVPETKGKRTAEEVWGRTKAARRAD